MFCLFDELTTHAQSLAKLRLVLIATLLWIQVAVAADTDVSTPSVNKFNMQLGLDAWNLNTPDRATTPLKGVDRLYLANSNTQWSYHSPAAWVKTTGQWHINSDIALTYKARADQSVGMKIDDLNIDYRLSPKLGFRAGVLDYKTSWCRTYEIDSPWIQEIDPFCTNRVTNEGTLASPGLQAYLSFTPSHYLIQALVGIYRPKAFGYNKDEFSNVANTKGVAINNRWGWSINALNLDNASEFRLSWLGARQENNRDSEGYRGQDAGALYLGASFYPTPKLNVRASLFNSLVNQASYSYAPDYTQILQNRMVRRSQVIELLYQLQRQDVLGFAVTKYTHDWNLTGMNGYEFYTDPNYYRFTQKGMSVSWRHDWERGIHTAIQWSTSNNDQIYWHSTSQKAKGNGLGLRIGIAY